MKKNRIKTNKKIAIKHIEELFSQAENTYKKDIQLASKYVKLARKISLKYKTPFKKSQKTKFCKKCETYLIPGQNARIRVNKGKIIVLCKNCKQISRYLYKKT